MKTLTKQECDVAHLLLIIIYFIVRVKDKLKYDLKKFILFIPSNFFISHELAGIVVCLVFLLGTTIAPGVLSAYYNMPPTLFSGGSQ